MADDHHSMSPVGVDAGKAKKYHEGWLSHKDPNGKWVKYWVVLKGNVLHIFKGNNTNERTVIGTLYLGPDTQVRSPTPENKRKKSYKFELLTTHRDSGHRKVNKFKFDKENDRDVWKSYIMGISTGILPRDVHLLPGQLKDVVEAIGDHKNTPPPLPSLPRPRVHSSKELKSQFSTTGTQRSSGSEASEGSGSFHSHITSQSKPTRSKSVPRTPELNGEPVANLRTLYRRPSEHTMKMTRGDSPPMSPHTPTSRGRGPNYEDHVLHYNDAANNNVPQWSGFSIGKPPPKAAGTSHEHVTKFSELDDLGWGDLNRPISPVVGTMDNHRPTSPPPVSGVPEPPPLQHNGGSPYGQEPAQYPTMSPRTMTTPRQDYSDHQPPRMASDYGGSSTGSDVVHMFYSDTRKNHEYPPWFFENTTREEAESILTLGKRHGNVLMRESVTFKDTGSYVISMRREVAGGTTLNHYEVKKVGSTFKINVDNSHRPMKSLNEVMHFFVNQAGPGTQPMTTSDPRKFGLPMGGGGPPMSPTRGGQMHITDDDSGVDDDDRGSIGAHSSGSPPPLPPSRGMATTPRRPPGAFDQSRMSIPPAPPPLPPGATENNYRGWSNEGGFSDPNLNRTVPPRIPPTETLQRTASHSDTMDSGSNADRGMYYSNDQGGRRPSHSSEDYGQQNHFSPPPMGGGGAPPAPPPPPPPGMSAPPAPPPPGPPPPPAAPSFSPSPPAAPAPPTFEASPPPPAAGGFLGQIAGATLKPVGESPSSPPTSGFNTTPGRPGMRAAPLSFDDELKKRLVGQRENIYASGTQVLTSNYGPTS